MKQIRTRRLAQVFVSLLVLAAFGYRYWGIAYDLPFIYHPDEPVPIGIAQSMLKSGDLNPHFYHWPPLLIYLHLATYVPFVMVGKMLGSIQTVHDVLPPIQLTMGTTWAPMPTTVLMGRLISVISGTATVFCIYWITKRLSNSVIAGFIAAVLMTVSPTSVHYDRFLAPDSLATFLIVLTFVFAVQLLSSDRWSLYLWGGFFVGLAATAKYNAVIIAVTIVAAHFLRTGWGDWRAWQKLFASGVLAIVGFLLANPFSVLDFPAFWEGISFNATHYSSGHDGMEGDTFRWYVRYLWRMFGFVPVLALVSAFWGAAKRDKSILLATAFPALYFLLIVRFIVRNGRTIMPLTPFLFILAGILIFQIGQLIHARLSNQVQQRVLIGGLAALTLLMVGYSLRVGIDQTLAKVTPNSRETARVWLNENLPEQATIGLESYSPFASIDRFSVVGVARIIDHPPEWYVENGYDYLVFSEDMFGRYYRDPVRYKAEIDDYERFFEQFEAVNTFNDGDYEVKIFKIR